MITPSQIRTDHWFMGSVFQNSECETILRNIIVLQKKKNENEWTSFSWQDYKEFCTHDVHPNEKNVLDCFVKGGKPVWNTSAYIDSGWLEFDGEKYSFTNKMINMLYAYYSYESMSK